jgi:hypothetical protein
MPGPKLANTQGPLGGLGHGWPGRGALDLTRGRIGCTANPSQRECACEQAELPLPTAPLAVPEQAPVGPRLRIDGTFYDGDELPGRDLSELGHPLMTDTMGRFADRLGPDFELWFIHLNHSNPVLDPDAGGVRDRAGRSRVRAVTTRFVCAKRVSRLNH